MSTVRHVIGFLIVAVSTMVASLPARSQSEAPFGFNWAASVEDLRAAGIELKDFGGNAFGTSYSASKLPKILADEDTTLVSFGFNNKLWRIIAISNQFENDPYGIAVKNRYQELLGVLAEKYGKPTSVHRLGGSIYSEPRYFISGIRGGESSWFSNFSTSDLDVQLNISASDGSSARWRIIFENKPLRRTFESDRKDREKRAL
jgi:hypothetical protein